MKEMLQSKVLDGWKFQIFDEGAGGEQGNTGEGGAEGEVTYTQAELLQEVDKRVGHARSKWESGLPDIIAKAIADHEEQAKLSDKEKKAQEAKKAEQERLAKEKELLRRELTLDARELLSKNDLPQGLLSGLDFTSREDLEKSIEVIGADYKKAVAEGIQAGIEKRLGENAHTPSGGGANTGGTITAKEFKAMTSWEKAKLAKDNPQLFNELVRA